MLFYSTHSKSDRLEHTFDIFIWFKLHLGVNTIFICIILKERQGKIFFQAKHV